MSDISALYSVGSEYIKGAAQENTAPASRNGSFGTFLQSAVDLINETNRLSDAAKTEKMNVALGYSENTHDLTIATSKADAALQYTIAVRDKFMEAYKEIMNIQI